MFCFDLKVFGLNRKVSLCPRQFLEQIKLFCFVTEFLGQKRTICFGKKKFGGTIQKVLLTFRSEADQMKTFCFCSDNKHRYRNSSRFVSISLKFLPRIRIHIFQSPWIRIRIRNLIQIFYFISRKKHHYLQK